jgi:hypothetical protein
LLTEEEEGEGEGDGLERFVSLILFWNGFGG